MSSLAELSRGYQEFFDTYEETVPLGLIEKARMQQINRLLNKIGRVIERYQT